ncbi:MAG: NAD(P)/FAD-dependent oxidoreductase [Ktedonobacterales bacterium]
MDEAAQHSQPQASKQVVILGAGPAGLTAGYELMKHRVPVTVLEQDSHYVGGISRTVERDGYRFDIGGHRFFSKSQEVEDLWTEVLGDDLVTCGRLSRIYYQGKYFDYPLKATNALFNMGPVETVRCLSSYAWARIHPIKNPQNLEDWVSNQFGHRLFSIFFKTYTEKVWGMSTKDLSADWAAQRIKGLNMAEAIRNALFPQKKSKGNGKGRGAVITTLIDQFRYPRLGPGMMWERTRDLLVAGGNYVAMGQRVAQVCWQPGVGVQSVLVQDRATGETHEVRGTDFLSTLPIRELVHSFSPALPPEVQTAANNLKYRDFLTVAVVIDRAKMFPDNWIYIHDASVVVGRMQNFKNWSKEMVPDQSTTCLGLEYFCFEGDGLWTSTDDELVALARKELAQLGMCKPEEVLGGVVVRQPKAYPVYDDIYKSQLAIIHDYLSAQMPNLQLVGRNGMHHYNNQDHSMMTALLAARNIALGTTYDPWKVNTDAEYHEEARFGDDDTSGRQVPKPVNKSQPELANVEK